MFSEALGELRQAFTLSGGRSIVLAVLAYASAVAGERATALKMLDQLHERVRRHDVSPLHAAYVHVGLAHFDEAFRLMERAYQERAGLFVFLNVEPIFDPLRSDPRFADLVGRLQFPG